MNEIIQKIKSAIVWMTLFFALVLIGCIALLVYDAVKLSDVKNFTIIMFNFLTPLLLFTGIIILFLAFYLQKKVNDDFRKEVSVLKKEALKKHTLEDLTCALELLNRDIAAFTVLIPVSNKENYRAAPYNSQQYVGVQGICIYLSDYYERITNDTEKLTRTGSAGIKANYHFCTGVLEQFVIIQNHLKSIHHSKEEHDKIKDLLNYTYRTKLKYAIEIIISSGKTGKLETAAKLISQNVKL